jgi:signal transduction histidine kinase
VYQSSSEAGPTLHLENSNPASKRKLELRVLIVAPTGADASLLCAALNRAGIDAFECPSCEAACYEMEKGAACLLVAEEALKMSDIQRFATLIGMQPRWSDFPLILLTMAGEVTAQSQRRRLLRAPLVRVLELERPIRPETLVSTVQTAIRARIRQYEVRDHVEKQREAEEALRRSEKLAVAGRLAASIAHEINNPLEAVVNLVFLARTSQTLDGAREYLGLAESELARVSAITNETLKFYRQPNKPTGLQVAPIFESLLLLYHQKLQQANINVETDFRRSESIVAFGGELRQMFSNLLTNAIDASRNGRILLRVRPAVNHAGTRGVRVTVADTGSGIPAAMKPTIFEPFVSTKGMRGTGLGLWVTSEIVQKHGGSIRVKSSTGTTRHGTVFYVFLPAMAITEISNAPTHRMLREG